MLYVYQGQIASWDPGQFSCTAPTKKRGRANSTIILIYKLSIQARGEENIRKINVIQMNIDLTIIFILSFTNARMKHIKNAINLWYILHVDK